MAAPDAPADDPPVVPVTITFDDEGPTLPARAQVFHAGERLGRYQVTGTLGEGGMGVVVSAYDPELDRRVAIKLLRAGGAEATRRLQAEARAMARVSHENVVVVHDVGTIGERLFVAMELVDGETLTTWQARERDWAGLVSMYLRAGRGLAAAHDAGLVHRDFKPSNVLVGSDGRVRVSDFGLATAARDVDLPAAGTPRYMAPEQHLGRPVSTATDQFSFCAALWEALWGEPPFSGDTLEQMRASALAGDIAAPPGDVAVPGWIEEVLRRGLSVDPAARFATMGELLHPLAQGGPRDRLVGIWDGRRARDLTAAFEATGRSYATDTAAIVRRRLDDYAVRWVAAHEATFQASHIRGEVSPALLARRMTWLSHRLDELRALIEVFVCDADAEVLDAAVYAVGRLEAPEDVSRVANPGDAGADLDATSAEARTAIDRANALERAGKYTDGLEIAKAICEGAGDLHPTVALAARLAHGRLLDHVGQFDAAAEQLRAAASEAARLEDDDALATAWSHLVWVLGNHQARHEAAESLGWAATAAVARAGDPAELRGDLENNLGSLAHVRGRYDDALVHHERALEARRAAPYPDPGRVAWSLNNLATVVSHTGDYQRALTLHDECVALRRESLGADHPDVAVSLINVGCVHAWLEDYQRELACFEQATDIVTRALGPDHFKVGLALHNKGDALAMLGDFEAALAAQTRALEIFESNLGAEHILIAFVLTAVGECRLGLDQPDDALVALQRADRLQQASESDAAERGKTLFALARALWATGERGGARERAEAALAALEPAGDHGASKRREIRDWLAGHGG